MSESTHYRKAKKEEIHCWQCKYSQPRAVSGKLECTYGGIPYYAVGMANTCDKASR